MAIRLQDLIDRDPADIDDRVRRSYKRLVSQIVELSAIDDLPSETLDRAVEALEAACDLPAAAGVDDVFRTIDALEDARGDVIYEEVMAEARAEARAVARAVARLEGATPVFLSVLMEIVRSPSVDAVQSVLPEYNKLVEDGTLAGEAKTDLAVAAIGYLRCATDRREEPQKLIFGDRQSATDGESAGSPANTDAGVWAVVEGLAKDLHLFKWDFVDLIKMADYLPFDLAVEDPRDCSHHQTAMETARFLQA